MDVIAPATGADHTVAEFVGLTPLEPNPTRGVAERLVGYALGPERQDALLHFTQTGALSGGEGAKRRFVALLRLRDAALARPPREILWHHHAFIDDAQVAVVVEQARVRGDLGVDTGPERDHRLDGRGAGENLRAGPSRR